MVTLLITVYIVSAYLMYKHTTTAYSKYGRWWNLRIRTIDLIFCFIPAVNTLSVFIVYIFYAPLKRDKNKSLFERIQYFLSKGKKFAPRETHFH